MMDIIYSHIYGWHVNRPSWSLLWIEVGYEGQVVPTQGCLLVQHTVGGDREEGGEDIGAVPLLLVPSRPCQE